MKEIELFIFFRIIDIELEEEEEEDEETVIQRRRQQRQELLKVSTLISRILQLLKEAHSEIFVMCIIMLYC